MEGTSANEELFDHLVRCETRIYNALTEGLKAGHGIGAAQFEFLQYLGRHPQSRVADLAVNFAVGIGATSKGVDRLEARGWVRRVPNPEDRRSSLVELTPAGRELTEAMEQTFREQLDVLIGSVVGEARAAAVIAVLAELRGVLEERGVGLPAG
ncbi:MarR family transcriptional regulator [Amycolatopsis rubida]|uniref:MarR family transcriptional regulator n=1 Tax=Amycolatopsis rubida TaxID=112413 RepID=A0ABX0C0J8_9PSEU|nr:MULTISPECIES: MarR family transcriptional regulator [Amycolatopsis]MYW95844.1 MarR family transcriptional regulator [Amycolatopsis rubida]NEC60834.1 MarR family transcriptional regulator [Amycolatopsis rubida]OAP26697.1 Multiple antibiotic resistance protein MarR [Amycolatopsis sp. M39]